MIFREVKRVLKKSGSFYLNIGDTYSASWGNMSHPPSRDYPEGRPPQSYKLDMQPKCMVCIPERVMFAMIEDGWILRNKNIWHKPNSMPSSVKDRFTTSWEYLYFFSKNNTTILWRNRETGEWRDTRPTRDENYPWGGMYQHLETGKFSWVKPPKADKDNWLKLQPLWMGFDYYFDLDAVRIPHKTQSLERYQRQVNFDATGKMPANKYIGEEVYPGGQQIYRGGRNLAPDWFQEMFPLDENYKGKFDDPNWREEAAKRGQLFGNPPVHQGGGNTGLGKHHGSSHDGRAGFDREHIGSRRKSHQPMDKGGHELPPTLGNEAFNPKGKNPRDTIETPLTKRDQAVGRTGNVSYSDPLHTRDYSPKGKNPGDTLTERQENIVSHFEKKGSGGHYLYRGIESPEGTHEHSLGKNPGDYWGITTRGFPGAHFAVFPEKLCERPIKASSRVGDVVLDPFSGSGTTGVVAKRLGRKAILIDCVESYCAISKERISKVEYQPELGIE